MGKFLNMGGRGKKGGNNLWPLAIVGIIALFIFTGTSMSDIVGDIGGIFGIGGGGDNGGGGTGDGGGLFDDDEVVAYNLWEYTKKNDMQAPDINFTMQDARFYGTETIANPTSDGAYVYWFTENPLLVDPAGSEQSYFDRLRLHVSEANYIPGTSAIAYNDTSKEIMDKDLLTALVTAPASYGETDGILYLLVWDTGYVDGTISSSNPGGFPVVLSVDLRSIPVYSPDAEFPPYYFITFGKDMKGIKQVWPADAGGASNGWSTVSAGWPEAGSVTLTDTNSTTDNYVDWAVAFADGGVYYWDPVGGAGAIDTICRIKANATTMTYTKVEIENTEVSYIEVTNGGYTELYVKVPREYAVEGRTTNVRVYYGTTSASTYLKNYVFMGEYDSFSAQSLTSALAKTYELASEDSDDGHCT